MFNPAGMETPLEDIDALAEMVSPGDVVVEVGSWVGRTAIAMADAGATVYCVDHWRGSPKDRSGALARTMPVFSIFCQNVGDRLFRSIIPCAGASLTWAKVWPFPVDLIFLDADHEESAVKSDILAWERHLKPGAILCGHDYGLFPGVKKAVEATGGHKGIKGRLIWWR